jgi:hypothetical protein
MAKRITLHLNNALLARANEIAERTGQHLEDILAEWLDRYTDDIPVEDLSDEDVLALCDYEMNVLLQQEMRNLLYHQRERKLSKAESIRLDELLMMHRKKIVRKARALEVAAVRGLR